MPSRVQCLNQAEEPSLELVASRIACQVAPSPRILAACSSCSRVTLALPGFAVAGLSAGTGAAGLAA